MAVVNEYRYSIPYNYAAGDSGWGLNGWNVLIPTLGALTNTYIKSDALATPPGSPVDGDCYIVAANPTDVWQGQAGKIAAWQNAGWRFYAPVQGQRAYVLNKTGFFWFNGSAWGAEVTSSGGGGGSGGGFASTFTQVTGNVSQNVGSGAFTRVALTSEVSDTGNNFDTTTYQYTVPSDGVYLITAALRFTDGFPPGYNFGLGVDTNEGDGPNFLWQTTPTLRAGGVARQGALFTRQTKQVAGDKLSMYCYIDGTNGLISYAALSIIRIA